MKDFSTGYHSRNGGGDYIITDGDLPILELKNIKAKPIVSKRPGVIYDRTSYETDDEKHESLIQELWSRRPPQILLGCLLVLVTLLLSTASLVYDIASWQALINDIASGFVLDGMSRPEALASASWLVTGTMAGSVLLVLFEILLVYLVLKGSNQSRILLLGVASATAVFEMLGITIGKLSWATAGLLLISGLHIAIVLMFSTDAARRFTRAKSRKKYI